MESKEGRKIFREKISKGLEKAHAKMVEFKKYKKTPIVVSRDGEIVELNPNDFLPMTTSQRPDALQP